MNAAVGEYAQGNGDVYCLTCYYVANRVFDRSIIYSSYAKPADTYFGQCASCMQHFCGRCKKPEILPVYDSPNKLKVSGYLGKGSSSLVIGQSDVEESEEPNSVKIRYCSSCQSTTTFIFTKLSISCYRCLSMVPSSNSSCTYHPGVHELPCRSNGEVCYIAAKSCINYNVFQYKIALHVGRWSCCGGICRHNTPQCPYFSCPDIAPEQEYLGCQPCDHSPETLKINQCENEDFKTLQLKIWESQIMSVAELPSAYFKSPEMYPSGPLISLKDSDVCYDVFQNID